MNQNTRDYIYFVILFKTIKDMGKQNDEAMAHWKHNGR